MLCFGEMTANRKCFGFLGYKFCEKQGQRATLFLFPNVFLQNRISHHRFIALCGFCSICNSESSSQRLSNGDKEPIGMWRATKWGRLNYDYCSGRPTLNVSILNVSSLFNLHWKVQNSNKRADGEVDCPGIPCVISQPYHLRAAYYLETVNDNSGLARLPVNIQTCCYLFHLKRRKKTFFMSHFPS